MTAPLASIKENAAEESFFSRVSGWGQRKGLLIRSRAVAGGCPGVTAPACPQMFGTDCWTQALHVVEHSCRKLGAEQQARFAVALFNCHMRLSGKRTITCNPEMPVKVWAPKCFQLSLPSSCPLPNWLAETVILLQASYRPKAIVLQAVCLEKRPLPLSRQPDSSLPGASTRGRQESVSSAGGSLCNPSALFSHLSSA